MAELYDFWLGTSTSKVGLEGLSLVAPVQGAQHRPGYGSTETIEDLITVLLEDKDVDPAGASGIATLLGRFEQIFNLARLYHHVRLGDEILLHQEPIQNEIRESRVIDGWVEVSPLPTPAVPAKGFAPSHRVIGPTESRLNGSIALLLHVIRLNWWQQPEIQIPTWGVAGNDGTNGTTLVNHYQAATNSNYVELHLENLAANIDLPTPCRLEMTNLTNCNVGFIYVGHNFSSSLANQAYTLDDATSTGGTSQADGTCHGGTYKDLAWSGTGWGSMLVWTVTAAFIAACKSNFFKFLLRLGVDLPDTDMEMKVKIIQTGSQTVLGESAPITCAAGQRLQEFSMLRIPPFSLRDMTNAEALDIALYARQISGVNHYFHADYLQPLPCNGFRKYENAIALFQNWKLTDDGCKETVTTIDAGGKELITHAAKGPIFLLQPRVLNSFNFAWGRSNGGHTITDQMLVKVWARPRRRIC